MPESLAFYKFQIVTAVILGAMTAVLGVFVLLRRFTVFGVTMSQAATSAVALTLFLGFGAHDGRSPGGSGLGGDLLILAFTIVGMAPLYPAMLRTSGRRSAVLVVGLVFFAALSQILVAFGGNVQNHLLAAFFGDVLTTPAEELSHLWPVIVISVLAFALTYRDLISLALDADHARISGVRMVLLETVFFLLLCVVSAQAINLMGSFYTLAQMIIPALFALAVSRSIPVAMGMAALYSFVGTLVGFVLSLWKLPIGGGVNLPTSSTIVVAMCIGLLLLPLYRLFVRARAAAGRIE